MILLFSVSNVLSRSVHVVAALPYSASRFSSSNLLRRHEMQTQAA
jgi:hypothetical protein